MMVAASGSVDFFIMVNDEIKGPFALGDNDTDFSYHKHIFYVVRNRMHGCQSTYSHMSTEKHNKIM